MRADIENRIYENEKKSNKPFLIAVCGTVAIFAAGLYLLNTDKADNVKIEQVEVVEDRPAQPNRYAKQRETSQNAQRNLDKPIKHEPKQHSQNRTTTRQTVFNDDNYRPKKVVNTIQAPRQVNRPVSNRPKSRTVKKQATWTWQSREYGTGASQRTKRGRFSYTVKNGFINTSTVCKNYRYGSFDYRDCRKGAKAYFKNACRNGNREACSAANMAL